LLIFIKMRREIKQEIEIPEGIEINVERNAITVKGNEGENKRTFDTTKLVFEKIDGKIIIKNEKIKSS